MKEITVRDIRGIFDDCWVWVMADNEEDEPITVFTQSNDNYEIPHDILDLPISLCTTHTNDYGESIVVCEISMQTLLENGAHIINGKITFPFNVYVCKASNCDYDEYDEVTVIAQSENRAMQMVEEFFNLDQKPIKIFPICECSATEEEVLTCSFNAG